MWCAEASSPFVRPRRSLTNGAADCGSVLEALGELALAVSLMARARRSLTDRAADGGSVLEAFGGAGVGGIAISGPEALPDGSRFGLRLGASSGWWVSPGVLDGDAATFEVA
jgi:hypothetical protein